MYDNQHLEATGTERSQITRCPCIGLFTNISSLGIRVLTPMDDHLKVVDIVET